MDPQESSFVRKCIRELRQVQDLFAKTHECGKRPRKAKLPRFFNNQRAVVKMEIRRVNAPVTWQDYRADACQFHRKSASIQAASVGSAELQAMESCSFIKGPDDPTN